MNTMTRNKYIFYTALATFFLTVLLLPTSLILLFAIFAGLPLL